MQIKEIKFHPANIQGEYSLEVIETDGGVINLAGSTQNGAYKMLAKNLINRVINSEEDNSMTVEFIFRLLTPLLEIEKSSELVFKKLDEMLSKFETTPRVDNKE